MSHSFEQTRMAEILDNLKATGAEIDTDKPPPMAVAAMIITVVKLDIMLTMAKHSVSPLEIVDSVTSLETAFAFVYPALKTREGQAEFNKFAAIVKRDFMEGPITP